MTTGQFILVCISLLSFVMGRYFGRVSVGEEIVAHARWMDSVAMKIIFIDYVRLNKAFHWRTELLPGFFYYGLNVLGVKIGYTKVVPQPVPAPSR